MPTRLQSKFFYCEKEVSDKIYTIDTLKLCHEYIQFDVELYTYKNEYFFTIYFAPNCTYQETFLWRLFYSESLPILC